MADSPGKTVDVIVGSPTPGFLETIKTVLKGYYPYILQEFKSVDEIIDASSNAEFKPILALIDGAGGTNTTNEWVQTTKMNYPDCHLIVLHSSAPLDFNIVKKNGADEVMHVNFDREFISDMVLQLAPIELEGENIPITALMPVDLRDMEANINLNFDVYAHLPANHRSVVLRRSGDVIEDRHVEKFKNMRQQMYVKKTQMKQFFEFARTIMSMRNLPFPISMTEKFHRSKKNIYEFMQQFLNAASGDYSMGKAILDKCKTIISELELNKTLSQSELYDEVCRYTGNTRSYYHDCLCVSAYAAYFAQLLEWPEDKRESAAISGLLHNIGLSQANFAATEIDITKLSPELAHDYKYYPERSVNMVKAKKVPINQDIQDGIMQHRENLRGTGFPKGLPGDDISAFGKLLFIAYSFHEATALRDGIAAAAPQVAMAALKEDAISGKALIDLVMISTIAKKFKP
ncbi:HD-GYP domain-containing protein [Bdellovibrio sp. HCB185ZH]|uniref:HD-GYP domain-containing protein n=1 Tax=Bdellovibrio sp. HCB185ZH TaxID=3394235 RepID=UPI0039A46569